MVYFAQGFRSLSSLSIQLFCKDTLGRHRLHRCAAAPLHRCTAALLPACPPARLLHCTPTPLHRCHRAGLSPASLESLLALSALPWSAKPLYGLVSDSFPIGGQRVGPGLGLG